MSYLCWQLLMAFEGWSCSRKVLNASQVTSFECSLWSMQDHPRPAHVPRRRRCIADWPKASRVGLWDIHYISWCRIMCINSLPFKILSNLERHNEVYGVINSKLIVSYTLFWTCPSPNTSLEDPNRPNGLRGLVPNKHGTSLQRQSRLVWVWRSKGDFLMW